MKIHCITYICTIPLANLDEISLVLREREREREETVRDQERKTQNTLQIEESGRMRKCFYFTHIHSERDIKGRLKGVRKVTMSMT